jgi:hypothetical protein
MDTPQPQPTNTEANIRKAAEAIAEVLQIKQEFIRCHEFIANKTARLVELLGQAESRGYLLEDALTLVDTTYWLQHIDWQTKFLGVVLAFAQEPSSKTLRPLIELYGRDRDRMKVEVEILERQLKHRLAHFAKPDDATVRKVIMKNEQRILAVHLHVRSGSGTVLQGGPLDCLWMAGVVREPARGRAGGHSGIHGYAGADHGRVSGARSHAQACGGTRGQSVG